MDKIVICKNGDITEFEFISPEKLGSIDPDYPYPYSKNWEGQGVAAYKVTLKNKEITHIDKKKVGNDPYIAHWEVDPTTGIQTNIFQNYTYGNGPDPFFDFVKNKVAEFQPHL